MSCGQQADLNHNGIVFNLVLASQCRRIGSITAKWLLNGERHISNIMNWRCSRTANDSRVPSSFCFFFLFILHWPQRVRSNDIRMLLCCKRRQTTYIGIFELFILGWSRPAAATKTSELRSVAYCGPVSARCDQINSIKEALDFNLSLKSFSSYYYFFFFSALRIVMHNWMQQLLRCICIGGDVCIWNCE